MCRYKGIFKMTPLLRGKTPTLFFCLVLVVVVFVLHQSLFSTSGTLMNTGLLRNKDKKSDVFFNLDPEESKKLSASIKTLAGKTEGTGKLDFNGEKLIHLDLKGAPPLVSYLKEFIPFIKKLGATGILIEYEDMFPYEQDLESAKAHNAYTHVEINEILELAEMNELIVIPLIQTLGHLEFVLKLNEFREFREVDKYPQVLCPSHDKVLSLIFNMIDQIVKAHPKSTYIHLGCDEVYHLGKCDKCVGFMKKYDKSRNDLFLNHVKNLGLYINKTYPKVRPIVWYDMFVQIDENLIKKYDIPSYVDLMLWKYKPKLSDFITDNLMDIYSRLFKNIWIAGAFKGAGEEVGQIVTDTTYHFQNLMEWMKLVHKWKKNINFKGLVLTGWQRNDHFSVLLELLPVSIPSLTYNLVFLKQLNLGGSQITKEVLNVLQCSTDIPLLGTSLQFSTKPVCNFPGHSVYTLVTNLDVLTNKIKRPYPASARGWFSLYNIVYGYSNPFYVESFLESWPVERYRKKLKFLEVEFKKSLSEVYDKHTVEEWLLTYVIPIEIQLDAIYNAKEAMDRDVWPVRPLLNGSDLVRSAAKRICNSNLVDGCGRPTTSYLVPCLLAIFVQLRLHSDYISANKDRWLLENEQKI